MKKIAQMGDMASLREYKLNGKFNPRVLATCPSLTQCHTSSGETLVHEPVSDTNQPEPPNQSIGQRPIKLMGRIDFIELNEQTQEIYVQDEQGTYILHDCALQDLQSVCESLQQVGGYYISRSEKLLDPACKPYALRDRHQVCHDLLEKEANFQFGKAKLCRCTLSAMSTSRVPWPSKNLCRS